MFRILSFVILFGCLAVAQVCAQTTGFTYQGSLKDGANPANGNYDLEFRLFDALAAGTQVGPLLTRSNVSVNAGVFGVSLDFGSVFPGANRFLDVRVRPAGAGTFTPLTPRQMLNSAPYSVKSITAENALQLGGTAANQYVLTGDPRMSDARDPLPGSAGYIQNTTVQQPSSNLNITGNATVGGELSANTVNASGQYNILGSRVLDVGGLFSMSVGLNTGIPSTNNSTLMGSSAGALSTGNGNSMFGSRTGDNTTSGNSNSFFGSAAGDDNTTGNRNSYFGRDSGMNSTGSDNSFFGYNTGASNFNGSGITLFGSEANASGSELTNATAIGAFAEVTQSNSLVLGSVANINGATSDTNVGIGTRSPQKKLHVVGPSSVEIMIESSDFQGRKWTLQSSSAANGGRFEIIDRTANANRMTILDDGSVGIGTTAPTDKLHVAGTLRISTLGAAGATHLCRNASNQIATCTADRSGVDDAHNTSVEALRAEISALRDVNAAQQRQIDGQSRQIELLVDLVCTAANAGDGCPSK